jgi:hypothetical protein
MIRIFKNQAFERFVTKSGINNAALCKAVKNIESGLVDANLGGGVIKQRVAREGQGKSSGFRTMILFKIGTCAFFVHGFAKNEQDNISDTDLSILKKLATKMLNYTDAELSEAIETKLLIEVTCHEQTIS